MALEEANNFGLSDFKLSLFFQAPVMLPLSAREINF